MRRSDISAISAILVASVVAGACANLSSLQTARTVPEGRMQMYGGLTAVAPGPASSPLPSPSPSASIHSLTSNGSYPTTGLVGVRVGLDKSIDAGAFYALGGPINLDFKINLIDVGPLAISTGLGGGFYIASQIYTAILPVYVSFDLKESITVYAAPKYVKTFQVNTNNSTVTSTQLASTMGLRLGGERFNLYLELTPISNYSDPFKMVGYQGAVGLSLTRDLKFL